MPKTKLQPDVYCRKCETDFPIHKANCRPDELLICIVCGSDVCPKCRSEVSAFIHSECETVEVSEVKIYPV